MKSLPNLGFSRSGVDGLASFGLFWPYYCYLFPMFAHFFFFTVTYSLCLAIFHRTAHFSSGCPSTIFPVVLPPLNTVFSWFYLVKTPCCCSSYCDYCSCLLCGLSVNFSNRWQHHPRSSLCLMTTLVHINAMSVSRPSVFVVVFISIGLQLNS